MIKYSIQSIDASNGKSSEVNFESIQVSSNLKGNTYLLNNNQKRPVLFIRLQNLDLILLQVVRNHLDKRVLDELDKVQVVHRLKWVDL